MRPPHTRVFADRAKGLLLVSFASVVGSVSLQSATTFWPVAMDPAMIDPQMLRLLRCLQTHSPLRCADLTLRDRVNRAMAAGHVYNPFGRRLIQSLDEALVNAEGTVLYPVRQGIPQLLVDEMILLAQLDSPRQEENDG